MTLGQPVGLADGKHTMMMTTMMMMECRAVNVYNARINDQTIILAILL
jgi:hypothetical protein